VDAPVSHGDGFSFSGGEFFLQQEYVTPSLRKIGIRLCGARYLPK
jgi:pyruvate-formate lyase-activating enzyme